MARETTGRDGAKRAEVVEDGSEARARELFDVPESERGSAQDLLRRLMTLGLSGLFTTESAIRGALGDTVPREWVDFVSDQSDRTRDEFLARLAQEFVRVLENVDVAELAEQMLTGRTIEVKAEFRLGPRIDAGAKRETENGTSSKPKRRDEPS